MGSKKVKSKFKASKGNKLLKKKNLSVKILNFGLDVNKCESLKHFSQIRENYFKHLQSVIKENLESARNDNLQNNSLEKISLEIEQPALLACMQSEIYQQVMIKIIQDIKSSTEQMKLHLGIKKVLVSQNFEDIEISHRLKKETDYYKSNTFEAATNEEAYSHVPTISSIRANSSELYQGWSVQNVKNEYGSFVDVDNLRCQTDALPHKNSHSPLSVSCEAQDIMQTVCSPSTGEQHVTLYNKNSPKYLSPVRTTAQNQNSDNKAKESEYDYISCNLYPVQTTLRTEENFNTNLSKIKTNNFETEIANDVQVNQKLKFNSGESASTLKSRNHLHNSYEGPLIKKEVYEREDGRERSQTTKLVDNISADETVMSDSLSDEPCCNNTKHESLLSDRLEEMRGIFGIQDYEEKNTNSLGNDFNVLESEKCDQSQKNQICYNWRHEKNTNLYKLSRMISEVTPALWEQKRQRFVEYFGEDSDEENIAGRLQEGKLAVGCKERISHWVVKYLMPYYQSGRIVGRNVFKALGHRISKSVLRKSPFPDEWVVKYVVSKYFKSDKTFLDELDVLTFQPNARQ